MAKNLLTDRECRSAKCPSDRPLKRFADGEGLYLVAFKSGSKSWQYRYEYEGKEQIATLKGVESLADAREQADRLRKQVAAGENPKVVQHVERITKIAANGQTFEVLKDQWIEREARRQKWTASYTAETKASFANHLKDLNPIPVTKILASITAPILRHVENEAPGMVGRMAARLRAVMDFAVEEGHLPQNPLPIRRSAASDRKHFPAVTELAGVGELLRAFDKIGADRARPKKAHASIRRAHLLLVFTAMRISEVVNAEWREFDLEAGNWAIPRERMKIKDPARGPHIVPLPPVLLREMRAWRAADAKSAVFVCPKAYNPKEAILDVQVGAVYRDDLELTGTHSAHSWRAVFKSVCSDAGKSGEVTEAQLDHVVGNAVASAYDRSQRVELRRELMSWYEATLIAARDGAKVLPIKKQA
jgi:integrase